MAPQRIYTTFGLLLLMGGIIFDFGFLAPSVSRAFKADASVFLGSFGRYIHDLAKTYMLVLGAASLTLAALTAHDASARIDWVICLLYVVGSVALLTAAFWYASAGPSFNWEARCTLLTLGLLSLLLSLGLRVYGVWAQ